MTRGRRGALAFGAAALLCAAPAAAQTPDAEQNPMTIVRKVTPVLVVEAIEPVLPFWERLGFETAVSVPDGDRLGFAILSNGAVEIMYQTRASLRSDVAALADAPAASSLFIEVADLEAVMRAAEGLEVVVPRRRTFYGMDEIGVREPGGHVVIFAQPAAGADAPAE
jgi:uncharacterized glyoxalase superfamily protein PhnB